MQSPVIRPMTHADLAGVVALQPLAFPPPFDPEMHWDPEHLERHIELFPEGQFVAEIHGLIVGSCSNTRIDERHWQAHENWSRTVGGPELRYYDPEGTTLYGLDITVHPDFRKIGVGRAFYQARYDFVRRSGLLRYGTACRIPDYREYAQSHPDADVHRYAQAVATGTIADRTLTPLLRMGLTFLEVIEGYMPDPESADAAALLEWLPTVARASRP
ncbi:MAG: GNAT family N-acetyltransferase [Fimbriimonas sp.]